MTIKTDRLLIRPLSEADAQDMYEYSKSPLVGPNAGWKPHESIEETHAVLREVFLGKPGIFGIVLSETGRLIGSVGVMDDPKRENKHVMMLGYALGDEYWGSGYMTEAARVVVDFAFDEYVLDAISVFCYPDNERSRSVIKKLGFKYEGTLALCEELYDGSVRSHECYLLTRDEHGSARGA